jgi:hypothetical protein
MAAPNIGRRLRSLSPLAAGFVVIGVVSFGALGLAARAQERSANNEAMAALADIETAIGELSESSNLTANTGRPYKQAAQRAAAAVAGALGRLDWLTDHAGGNVWGPAVEGSLANLRIAKGDLDAAVGTDGLEQFCQRRPARYKFCSLRPDANPRSECWGASAALWRRRHSASPLTRALFPAAAYRPRHRPMASSTVT